MRRGVRGVVLVDDRPPLSMTSDKSTECYRNWWPGPGDTMVRFMSRSIDLLEELAAESGNSFVMNRNGYAYLTADPAKAAELERGAREISALGAGALRIHRGASDDPPYPEERHDELATSLDGADLVLDPRRILPALPLPHPRRDRHAPPAALRLALRPAARYAHAGAGARARPPRLPARVEEVEVRDGRVEGVRLGGGAAGTIATRCFVNAAGPFAPEIGRRSGVELPCSTSCTAR